jgi:hypothetical protein
VRYSVTISVVVRLAFLLLISIGSPVPSMAQELPVVPPPPAFAPAPLLRPFGDLFAVPRPRKPQPVLLANIPKGATPIGSGLDRRPLAACPMQTQPVDPAFDASMRQMVPDQTMAFTMRTAPRLSCRPN